MHPIKKGESTIYKINTKYTFSIALYMQVAAITVVENYKYLLSIIK